MNPEKIRRIHDYQHTERLVEPQFHFISQIWPLSEGEVLNSSDTDAVNSMHDYAGEAVAEPEQIFYGMSIKTQCGKSEKFKLHKGKTAKEIWSLFAHWYYIIELKDTQETVSIMICKNQRKPDMKNSYLFA